MSDLVKCPHCSKDIENDSFYCDQCGVPNARFSEKANSALNAERPFCRPAKEHRLRQPLSRSIRKRREVYR